MKPHVHKDVIIAYANGAEIEVRENAGYEWQDCLLAPCFAPNLEYRVKPEKKYPETRLPVGVYRAIWRDAKNNEEGFLEIANTAIRQHIIDTENK